MTKNAVAVVTALLLGGVWCHCHGNIDALVTAGVAIVSALIL